MEVTIFIYSKQSMTYCCRKLWLLSVRVLSEMGTGGWRGVGRNSTMDLLRCCWDGSETSSFDNIFPNKNNNNSERVGEWMSEWVTTERVIEWLSEWVGFNVPQTHYRSFRRRVSPANHLHRYRQPNKNNQETEHTNNKITQHKMGP